MTQGLLISNLDGIHSSSACLTSSPDGSKNSSLVHGRLRLLLSLSVLVDFQSRKAHRLQLRDEDLLKYLLGIVIVAVGATTTRATRATVCSVAASVTSATVCSVAASVTSATVCSVAASVNLNAARTNATTNFPTWASILIIGVVTTIYTTMGGIKAVVWTDFFQCGVMIAGLLALVIQGSISAGGMAKVWDILGDSKRIEFFNFDPNPLTRHTFWGLTIGTCISWLGTFGVNQTSVQRYNSLPTKTQARAALFLNIPFYLFMQITTAVAGMVIFAHYDLTGCDPLANKDVQNPNQLVPKFVLDVLGYPAVPGIFVASIYSGALSSVSSALSSLSAVTWQDILLPTFPRLQQLSEKKQAVWTKGLVAGYGVVGVAFAFVAMQFGGTVLQASLTFTGAAGGPLLGIFMLGMLVPFSNWVGCVVGGISGLVMAVWVGAGGYTIDIPSNYLPTNTSLCNNGTGINSTTTAQTDFTGIEALYTLSYIWLPTLAVVTTLTVGIIASCLTGRMGDEKVDPSLLINWRQTFCCCLPGSSAVDTVDPVLTDIKMSETKAPEPVTDDYETKEKSSLSEKSENRSISKSHDGVEKDKPTDEQTDEQTEASNGQLY